MDLSHLYKKCMHQFIHAYMHIHDNRCKHIGLNTCIRVKIQADLIAGILAFIRTHTRECIHTCELHTERQDKRLKEWTNVHTHMHSHWHTLLLTKLDLNRHTHMDVHACEPRYMPTCTRESLQTWDQCEWVWQSGVACSCVCTWVRIWICLRQVFTCSDQYGGRHTLQSGPA